MKHVVLVAFVGVVFAGCSRKRPEEGIEPPPAMPEPAGSGSAGSAAAAKPLTGDALAKRFDECWGFWNAAKWDDFKGCYTPDATSEVPGSGMPTASGAAAVVDAAKPFKIAMPDLHGEPVLELVNGHQLASVMFLSGTHTAPLKMPTGELAPTDKKVGVLMAQAAELDDTGHAKHEADYFDLATLVGQLTGKPVRPALDKAPMAKEVVIAKDDAKEKANLEVVKHSIEAFGKHDAKAYGDTLADDLVWSDQGSPADANKKQVLEQLQGAWKSFSDLKIVSTSTWAAGDYVVDVGTAEGTNDGPLGKMPATKKKFSGPYLTIRKLADGKIKTVWVFTQSLALAQQLGLAPRPAPAKP